MTTYPDLIDGSDSTPERQAAAAIRAFCGWHIAPIVTETLTFEAGAWDRLLMLPTLVVNSVAVTEGQQSLVENFDYIWRPAGMLRRVTGSAHLRPYALTVELTHGFTECPADVAAVAALLASNGPYAIDKYEAEALMPYKLVAVR